MESTGVEPNTRIMNPRRPATTRKRSLMVLLALSVIVVFGLFSSNAIVSQFPTFQTTHRVSSTLEDDIPWNSDSPFVRSDVSAIVHIPSKNSIQVHFKPERRCQNPLLQGRISGWSLSMIKFGGLTDNNTITGYYDLSQMPFSGWYNIEILVILCEKYGDDYRSIHLMDKAYCLEVSDDDSHQLTYGNGLDRTAGIEIQVPIGRKSPWFDSNVMGRWVHKSLLSNQSSTRDLLSEEDLLQLPYTSPVFTPHQCPTNATEEFCNSTGLRRQEKIHEYVYQWNRGTNEALSKDLLTGFLPAKNTKDDDDDDDDSKTVCFVGLSHSRVLMNYCNGLIAKTKELAMEQNLDTSLLDNVTCAYVKAKFPTMDEFPDGAILNNGKMGELVSKRCTDVVLGLFQWYPSQRNTFSKDINFKNWKDGMVRTVQQIQDFHQFTPSSLIRRIHLRSAHANGFKKAALTCPITDARTPLNAELASQILIEIVDEFRSNTTTSSERVLPVSMLDSRFLLDPVWDWAIDWGHYRGHSQEMEVKYFLSKILEEK